MVLVGSSKRSRKASGAEGKSRKSQLLIHDYPPQMSQLRLYINCGGIATTHLSSVLVIRTIEKHSL